MDPRISAIIGPTLSVNASSSLSSTAAKYESDFQTWSAYHWSVDGSDWAAADYYDRAEIDYVWYARTGDTSYLDMANSIVVNYRDNYLAPNQYAPIANWAEIKGMALQYFITGDETTRSAIGHVADYFSNPYYMNNIGNVNADQMDNRMQSKVLETFLAAWETNAPAVGNADWLIPAGQDWGALLHKSIDLILQTQKADGSYIFASDSAAGVKPFEVGMLNDALIDYYTNFDKDPRIITAVKNSLDYLWSHDWVDSAQAFLYIEHDANGEISAPAADLNNLIVKGYGWLYSVTGDAKYKLEGDQVFAGGVNGAWLTGTKQFNQEYTGSYNYLAYTHPELLAGSGTSSAADSTTGVLTPPPVISVTAPTGWLNTNSATFTVSASDSTGAAVHDLYVQIGNGAWTAVTPDASGHVTVDHLAAGVNSLDFKAVDSAGNSTVSSLVRVNVDVTAPTLSATPTSTVLASNSVTVDVSAADLGGSGLKEVDVQVNGGAWSAVSLDANGHALIGNLVNGTDTISLQAVDNAGNLSALSTFQVTVNPKVVIGTADSEVFTAVSGTTYTGGGGRDVFVLSGHYGNVVITDFETAGKGRDALKYDSGMFTSLRDVLAHATDTATGMTIVDNLGNSVSLNGVHKASLSSLDLIL